METIGLINLQNEYIPETISLGDIQNEHDILLQDELDMKQLLKSTFLNVSISSLRPSLITWAKARYPTIYPILSLDFIVPPICSDGTTRNAFDYLEYCLECTLVDVVNSLSAKLIDMIVSYKLTPTTFSICVTNPNY